MEGLSIVYWVLGFFVGVQLLFALVMIFRQKAIGRNVITPEKSKAFWSNFRSSAAPAPAAPAAPVSARSSSRYSYQSIPFLFTPAEQKMLFLLDSLLPSDVRLMGKIRVADLIKPAAGKDYLVAFRKISSKHIDFVVTDRNSRVLVCVELNDSSHQRKDRIERDAFLISAFASAHVPLVFIPLSGLNEKVVKQSLAPYFPAL